MRTWNFDNEDTEKRIIAEVEKYDLTVCYTDNAPTFEIYPNDTFNYLPIIDHLSLSQLAGVLDILEHMEKRSVNNEYWIQKGFDLAKRTVVSIKDTTHAKEVAISL